MQLVAQSYRHAVEHELVLNKAGVLRPSEQFTEDLTLCFSKHLGNLSCVSLFDPIG